MFPVETRHCDKPFSHLQNLTFSLFVFRKKPLVERCSDIAMTVQIQMTHIRKAKRRSTGGVEVDQCRDPRARGRRGRDQDRETRERKEVGPGIGETGRGPGAEAGTEGGTGVETEREAEAEIKEEAGVEATGGTDSSPGLILQRRGTK